MERVRGKMIEDIDIDQLWTDWCKEINGRRFSERVFLNWFAMVYKGPISDIDKDQSDQLIRLWVEMGLLTRVVFDGDFFITHLGKTHNGRKYPKN